MSGSTLLRVALGFCLAGFIALTTFILQHAIDEGDQARYAHDLRRLQTLDSGLNEAVLRARSGLLLQYDPLVAALGELHRLEIVLRKAPRFFPKAATDELGARLAEWSRSLKQKEELIETFKMENSVVQTSLHYFPVIATHIIDRARAGNDRAAFAARVQNLSSALMLFEAGGEADATERALHAQDEVRAALDAAKALGLDRDALVAIAHARVIVERKPTVDALVRMMLAVPSFQAALRAEETYSAHYRAAVDRSVVQKQLLFALALGIVVMGLTEVPPRPLFPFERHQPDDSAAPGAQARDPAPGAHVPRAGSGPAIGSGAVDRRVDARAARSLPLARQRARAQEHHRARRGALPRGAASARAPATEAAGAGSRHPFERTSTAGERPASGGKLDASRVARPGDGRRAKHHSGSTRAQRWQSDTRGEACSACRAAPWFRA